MSLWQCDAMGTAGCHIVGVVFCPMGERKEGGREEETLSCT